MASAGALYSNWLTDGQVESLGRAVGDSTPVAAARAEALRAFRELPLEPNALFRGYSNIAGAELKDIDLTTRGPPVGLPRADASTLRIVHDASGTRVELPDALREAGVTVETLPDLWTANGRAASPPPHSVVAPDKMTSYALATVNRAVRLTVPDRCTVPVRVHDLTVLSRPNEGISVWRELHSGSQSKLLYSEELFSTADAETTGQRLYASTVDLDLGERSSLHYLTLHAPDARAVSLYQRHARTGAGSYLAWVWAGLGGFRTRSKNLSELAGNGSALDDLQAIYGSHEQAYDSGVQITHIGTDTHGQSITRSLFKDKAQGVSRGLVRIEKDARKTLSYLAEYSMLLSKGARSDAMPDLEILCRDVKATHSSSVAPVDPEKIFYLESRGINSTDAVRMIGEGFLSNVLDRAPIVSLRDLLYPILAARWDGHPVLWDAAKPPSLPPLQVSDARAGEEWRFDAKLR
ncbi:MAG TPA: SufD family Fe-S cluster assembly protein [Thermoplasmata archaeon]|nr:SufD family Fe-S cluster assembly protein [Thermoplasmata archaeon]